MPCARNSRAADLLRLALEHVDEQLADGLALLLGVVDAGERVEEQLLGVHMHQRDVVAVAEQRDHLLGLRPSRSRPWSTNTQVSWSPIASWISTAATAESTPPERPQITLPLPTWRADFLDRLVLEGAHGPVAGEPGDLAHEIAQQRRAMRRVHDLEMELGGVELARVVGDHGDRRVGRGAEHLEAGRQLA